MIFIYYLIFIYSRKGRNHSPSDGSDEAGDDILLKPSDKKTKKRPSFNHRRWRTPLSKQAPRAASSYMTDTERLLGPQGKRLWCYDLTLKICYVSLNS